ncbi:WD40-repeat-containing domain protein [Dimargaris cristalligena]|uniref:Actin-related protein 2/3 complex subunit n=1 Tax=Dimargaris cristalligena TaxID=215637 RepID=A0A4P9ZWS0_9FUNG|nr:WD40-repeat-containing domain protein [Dimargaris cristalligena]|eukprot:RKP37788.1 WD40-repeat-containing domain protein [Dimargaris cristalligena]
MAVLNQHLFPFCVTAHAFNSDQSTICPNTNEVQIYGKNPNGSGWELEYTLSEHDLQVTSIDWAPQTNRLVTCSQDKNAYVWNFDGQTWKPTLVHLRINRAATFVKWSPREDKFAVASGSRCIAVCYFGEDNDWWVSKHLKKPITSTVLCLDWHPNNVLLAAGSADMKVRVFSAFIKGVDQKPAASVWGEKLPFNTVCAEYANPNSGWVHSVAFSPTTGDALAWVGHDSSLSVAYPGSGQVAQVRTRQLPLLAVAWASDTQLVAAGHDCTPMLFERVDAEAATNSTNPPAPEWKWVKSLDQGQGTARAPKMSTNSAFNMFRKMDSNAQKSTGQDETGAASLQPSAKNVHQNTITSLKSLHLGTASPASEFSTSGLDGKVAVWAF